MWTFLYPVCLVFLMGAMAFAEEEVVEKEKEKKVSEEGALGGAWLGLSLSKPDDAMANQLPVLPPGIGFVVTEVTEGGPAERAGLKRHDLLWKMNEQMLVNEGQLATLLRLANPGERAVVSVFRDGKSRDMEVKLGGGKRDSGECARKMLVDTVMREGDGAVRMVSVGEKLAKVANEDGRAEVSRSAEGDGVKIFNPEGEVIFEGVLRGLADESAVPDEWRKPVGAMRRTLDHALSVKEAPGRLPRPRIVPPVVE